MSYARASLGSKRKAEVAFVPFLNRSQPTSSADIDAKFMNTPHRMAEVGWLPHWELREGMRELLANMIDQARTVADKAFTSQTPLQFTEEPGRFLVHVGTNLLAEATMGYKKRRFIRSYFSGGCIKAKAVANDVTMEETQVIELINYSSVLPWTSFHVGHSTKRDNKSVIGKHGEGLTGACVVLNRAGCNVIADCTHNEYAAHVVRLSRDVCFQLKRRESRKKDLPVNTVRFTIVFDPSKPEVNLQELMSSVRLPTASAEAGIATPRGTLLVEKSLRGKQFNRSIFVGEDPNCLFGYDFHDPDKDLLQGRDRNSHGKQQCLVEYGSILSHAILENEEVRNEVLKCFLFGATYNPNGAGVAPLKKYEDIRDGEYLSVDALRALRKQCEANQPGDQKVVFCARNTGLLDEIMRVKGMTYVFTHSVMHNHHDVVHSFQSSLTRDARALDPDTRIGSFSAEIQVLLGVESVLQSTIEDGEEDVGFWIMGRMAYVTNVHALGARNASGLSEKQEISLFRTLQFTSISVENQVKMMRLLRNQSEPITDPTSASRVKVSEKPSATEPERSTPEQPRATKPRRRHVIRNDRQDEENKYPLIECSREELDIMLRHHFDSRPLAERVDFFVQTRVKNLSKGAPILIRDEEDLLLRPSVASAQGPKLPPHEMVSENLLDTSVELDGSCVDDDATQCSDYDATQIDNCDEYSVASADSHRAVGAPITLNASAQQQEETQVSDGESVISNVEEDMSVVSSVDGAGSIAVGLMDEDAFDLDSDREGEDEIECVDEDVASAKRRKLDCAEASSANTSLDALDLSIESISVASMLLAELPEDIALGAGQAIVTKIHRHEECGVWLYSDDPLAAGKILQLLNACIPTKEDRHKLFVLSSLLHVVVFVTSDQRAPPALNYGAQCVCINLACCASEQMFKYILHAQLQTVHLL